MNYKFLLIHMTSEVVDNLVACHIKESFNLLNI